MGVLPAAYYSIGIKEPAASSVPYTVDIPDISAAAGTVVTSEPRPLAVFETPSRSMLYTKCSYILSIVPATFPISSSVSCLSLSSYSVATAWLYAETS